MTKQTKELKNLDPVESLAKNNFLFKGIDLPWLAQYLNSERLILEKLYSSRPIFTAFRPDTSLEYLYAVVDGGRSSFAVHL